MKSLGLLTALVFVVMFVNHSISSDSKVTAQGACYTWDEFSRNLPTTGGRGGQWKEFGNLPPEFQNGCILLDNGNAVDVAYVLRTDVNSYPYAVKARYSDQIAPQFKVSKIDNLELLVTQGKALKVTWYTTTNGSIAYWSKAPRDRVFRGRENAICFNQLCLKSGAFSDRDLAKILNVR